jgi:hypothetical protein
MLINRSKKMPSIIEIPYGDTVPVKRFPIEPLIIVFLQKNGGFLE